MNKTNENKTPLTAEEIKQLVKKFISTKKGVFYNSYVGGEDIEGHPRSLGNLLSDFYTENASQQLAEKEKEIERLREVILTNTLEFADTCNGLHSKIQSLKEEVDRYKNLLLQRDNIIFNDEKSNRIKQLEEGISSHI